MTMHQDIIDKGCSLFATSHKAITKYDILVWLFEYAQEHKVELNTYETQRIVTAIEDSVTNVYSMQGDFVLTAGTLRKALHNVPDNMPVMYQRIDDSYFATGGWSVIPLPWETKLATAQMIEYTLNHPDASTQLITKDGDVYIQTLSDYIPSFSARVVTHANGKNVFCIDAHY